MSTEYVNYLKDIILLLRENADEAVMEAASKPRDGFASGRSMAYAEVLDLFCSQADSFMLSRAELGLTDFDIATHLSGGKR